MVSKEKEAKRILAASLYKPSIHGYSFRYSVADDIIQQSISNVSINTNSSYADIMVQSDVNKELDISNNRCMDIFDAKMGKLHEANASRVRFEVNQTDNDGKEIMNYWYTINYV